jgi:hypothetical protein
VKGRTSRGVRAASNSRALRCGVGVLVWQLAGCATLPPERAERSLYLDLRKIADADSGWTIDSTRAQANREPALRSACEVTPAARAELDAWLAERIRSAGGPAQTLYAAHGHELGAVSEVLSLERTRLLLRDAESHAAECPFWLSPRGDFEGVQGDYSRFVGLAETQAFLTVQVPHAVSALGGGGRLFVGYGLGPRTTLALGADLAASATFLPVANGIESYVTVAVPVLYRWSQFSTLWDIELAPVVRFSPNDKSWPPGARVEAGWGFSSVTLSSFMSYFMLYGGYEIHGLGGEAALDHTIQFGTRIGVDWNPHRN